MKVRATAGAARSAQERAWFWRGSSLGLGENDVASWIVRHLYDVSRDMTYAWIRGDEWIDVGCPDCARRVGWHP